MISGINTRTRSDLQVIEIVKNITQKEIVDLPSHIVSAIGSIYIKYDDDLYCASCYHTGTTIWYDGKDFITTDDCPCAKFIRTAEQHKIDTRNALIPEKFLNADVNEWKNPGRDSSEKARNEIAIRIITSYANKITRMRNVGYGLFLTGPNGVGKTYLACGIGNAAVRNNFKVKYYTMSMIVRSVIDGWYKEDRSESIIKDIEQSDFLIIDDVDKAYRTKNHIEIAVLDNLFRERMQNNRPMIMTSNRTLEQIRDSHGPSIYSMSIEHCAYCVIIGEDYRKGIAESIAKDILEGND